MVTPRGGGHTWPGMTPPVAFLGRSAVSEMVLKGKDVAVTCEFCGQSYIVTVAEMRAILHPDAH